MLKSLSLDQVNALWEEEGCTWNKLVQGWKKSSRSLYAWRRGLKRL
jgi:hypothetical protein